ncbi:hypothetical protein PABG_11703 [Paracoccidioides brasiliensis Pb03]|nr:hypothetical protein PABG_11703 [Paracoccidioides brasiliensis Pb03]
MVSHTETLSITEPKRDTSDMVQLAELIGLNSEPTANQCISHLLSKLPNLRYFRLHAFDINCVDNEPLYFSSSKKLVTLQLPAHYLLICLSSAWALPPTLDSLKVEKVD